MKLPPIGWERKPDSPGVECVVSAPDELKGADYE